MSSSNLHNWWPPIDTLITHANLVLIGVQLKETCLKTYAHLISCPTTHLITNAMRHTARTLVKIHQTVLHHLAKYSKFNPTDAEKIKPTWLHLGEYPNFISSIADLKEAAIKIDKAEFGRGKMIYTDRSVYKEQVGASAALFTNGRKTTELQYRLGPLTEHTVFEGELIGIILGFHLAHLINRTCNHINFSINNQATIKTLDRNDPQPAQYLIYKINHDINRLHTEELARREQLNDKNPQKIEIAFTWVAGHMGSVGNEGANKLAKQAAVHGSPCKNCLPKFLRKGLSTSLSAIKQCTYILLLNGLGIA